MILMVYEDVAGTTRLELVTFGVTGRYCNQLNYAPIIYLERIRPLA